MNKKPKSSDELIHISRERLTESIKNGYRYPVLDDATSNEVLRKHISKRIPMFVIFIDLVGSTKMSLEIPPNELGDIIRSFSQEVTVIIENFQGHVLKFVGDAVVAYFIPKNNTRTMANNMIKCTEAIVNVTKYSANPILKKLKLPPLHMHMGVEYGKCHVLLYGTDKKKSHIDRIGSSINLAAKMRGIAKTDQVVIGENVYNMLANHEDWEKVNSKRKWEYYSSVYCKQL